MPYVFKLTSLTKHIVESRFHRKLVCRICGNEIIPGEQVVSTFSKGTKHRHAKCLRRSRV